MNGIVEAVHKSASHTLTNPIRVELPPEPHQPLQPV